MASNSKFTKLLILTCMTGLVVAASPARADVLLIQMGKYTHVSHEPNVGGQKAAAPDQNSQLIRKFKVDLSPEFLGQFTEKPSQTSMGTGFYCDVTDHTDAKAGSSFENFTDMIWLRPMADGRISAMANSGDGGGFEIVNGRKISGPNPAPQVSVGFPSWKAIDLDYQMSFSNDTMDTLAQVQLDLSVQTVADGDPSLKDAKPVEVRKANVPPTFGGLPGQQAPQPPISISCGFQNG